MILKYYIEEEKILVKEYLELKGISRNLRKKARIEDIIYINGQKAKNFYINQSARDDQYTMFLHNDKIKNTAKAEAFFDIKNVKACFCINFESAAKAGRLGKKVSLLF